MLTTDVLDYAKFYISVLGLGLSFVAGILAFQSFRRNERWKKAEFLAKEIKEFFEDTRTQRAMLLIDWGVRRVSLLSSDEKDGGKVVVTRALQISALRPHTFLKISSSNAEMTIETADSDAEMSSGVVEGYRESFTPSEAAIRDCYDGFFDGLERLSSYVKTGLTDISALRPYIGYWIDDIHASTANKLDSAWSASLLTYISFYRFEGVLWLFDAFDRSIRPSSPAYLSFLKQMQDQAFASRLSKSVGIDYP
jgi:hypothetical protein